MTNLFYDGFNSKLIETAFFEGDLEIPKLARPKEWIIPTVAVPFSKRDRLNDSSSEMLVFYEQDPVFRHLVSTPQAYDDELKTIKILSTPDCSLYRDMPLWEQIANIGVSRSVGYYWQQKEKYVIPNVRWGDERTYTKQVFCESPQGLIAISGKIPVLLQLLDGEVEVGVGEGFVAEGEVPPFGV